MTFGAVKCGKAITLIVALPVAWFLFRLATAYFMPPEKTGRAYLLREARKRGINVSSIPDSAWDELVHRSIAVAKLTGRLDRAPSNWRAKLVDYLEIEAASIASVLNGEGGQETDTTRETLIKQGVNVPPSSGG